ncbi:MAG: PQQ-dependent sugar dehydrogenase, partial [Caldilineaceae bacterium]|nr:PQQ-dependent sugar dehydrogenase [Caldilineaceae bacterium]
SSEHPYAIPASNPFVNVEGYRPEIWALGLRNPWGFDFDPETGDLFIPDTGHSRREEVSFMPASSPGGDNYGWPTIEGTRCLKISGLPVPCHQASIFVPPVAEYDRARGCAVVGGVVYRGSEFPHLSGRFLFSDFCRGDILGTAKTHYIRRSELNSVRPGRLALRTGPESRQHSQQPWNRRRR